ncbi:MAG TPA: NBR1-Ig-like domain-containing protein [Casimicrobiaceae bacterium]|nr:NBR1-Ig-like domain-containing protein [Casimicrobiaceae bacterium]
MSNRVRRRATRDIALASCGALLSAALAAPAGAQPAYSAAFVSQSAPAFVQFQTSAAASITMRNTGTATWYRADGDVFLATQEPQDNYYWCVQDNRYGSHSGNRVLLPYDVAPDQDVTFDFVIKPLACGFTATAPFSFRMLSQTYGTFGEETPGASVVVSTAAEFVSQQVPSIVPAGAAIQVTVTFKNTTKVTWLPTDGYALGSAAPTGNTTWGVANVALPAPVAPGETVTFEFAVVAPATPGSYNFQWQMNLPPGTPFGLASPATAVEVVAAGPPNYEGLWWNSPAESEPGWGLNLAHQGNVIFATWFTYDSTGKGWWLSMTASPTTLTTAPAATYSGTLLQSSGPPFDSVPFNPSLVRSVAAGTATLTFTDANNGTFTYTINGATQTKNITREVFGPLPTCTFGILSDLTQAYNYQDLWWAAPAGSESGWGINLTHQGDTIFATWFTYGTDRAPMWLVATAGRTAPGTYAGTLYRTTGPPFNAVPFDPARVVATAVGTATLTFTDGNNGTFAYTVNGETQQKAITRQIFTAPGTVCQ